MILRCVSNMTATNDSSWEESYCSDECKSRAEESGSGRQSSKIAERMRLVE